MLRRQFIKGAAVCLAAGACDVRAPLVKPDGGMLLPGGGIIAPGGGLLQPAAATTANRVDDILAASDPAGLLSSIMGVSAPNLLWGGNWSSGARELVGGTDDLADASTPGKSFLDPVLDATCTTFDAGTAQSMDAASNTVADVGSEAVAVLWVGMFNGDAASQDIIGKSTASGGIRGYGLSKLASGGVRFAAATATGEKFADLAADHGTQNQQVIVGCRSWASDILGLYTREGYNEGTRHLETLANSGVFACGSGRQNAAASSAAMFAVWTGTNAEELAGAAAAEPARFALAEWLGYEI